jgi:hypothetical protein
MSVPLREMGIIALDVGTGFAKSAIGSRFARVKTKMEAVFPGSAAIPR